MPGVELEFGVPIPGVIVPESEWSQTAFRRFPAAGPLAWGEVFGRAAPVVLDLGCGNGRFTLGSAIARPDHDHFALDSLPMVIRYATRRANQRGLRNVRFAVGQADRFLGLWVADGSVAEIHVYHPQPYHDRRDWRRRLITPGFLAEVALSLAPGGLFVVQTDSAEYWRYMEKIAAQYFAFERHDRPWPDAPAGRTRREILALQRGLPVYRGIGRKTMDRTRDELSAIGARLPLPKFRTHRPTPGIDRAEASEADQAIIQEISGARNSRRN